MKQGQLMESDTAAEPGSLGKSRSDNKQTQTRETREEYKPLPTPTPAVASEEIAAVSQI